MGIFQSIHVLYYALLVCAILLSIRALMGIFGGMLFFSSAKRTRVHLERLANAPKGGKLEWTFKEDK